MFPGIEQTAPRAAPVDPGREAGHAPSLAAPHSPPPPTPPGSGASPRTTRGISGRLPVLSGPPTTATTPALAVRAFVHERASATTSCPTRGSPAEIDGGATLSGLPVRSTTTPVA